MTSFYFRGLLKCPDSYIVWIVEHCEQMHSLYFAACAIVAMGED